VLPVISAVSLHSLSVLAADDSARSVGDEVVADRIGDSAPDSNVASGS